MDLRRKEELLQKGWRQQDLVKAEAILDRATKHDIFFSKIVFWSALVVIVFANLLISIVLIPFLLALYDWALYGIVTVLALCIGFLYNFLVNDIGLLETKHHRLASIIVPIVGMGNVVIMVLTSNRFIESLKLNYSPHNPWLVAVIFGVSFILPYAVDQIRMSLRR